MKISQLTPTKILFGVTFMIAAIVGYAHLSGAVTSIGWDDQLPLKKKTVEKMLNDHTQKLDLFAGNISRSQSQQNEFWVKSKRRELRETIRQIFEQEESRGRNRADGFLYDSRDQLRDEIQMLVDENKELAK